MSQLPDYVASATPNPFSNRVGWLTTTAAVYAGVMLWFAFWQDVPSGAGPFLGGTLIGGLGLAIGALVLAALLCYFLCYIVPGMLGMKTGLSLTVVGTSTYGVTGGYIMPGFLMGALQFGWLSVNAYFAGLLLTSIFMNQEVLIVQGAGLLTPLGMMRAGLGVAWILVATFAGLKGVQYVGKVASFSPILPIGVLVFLLISTIGGVKDFDPAKLDSSATVAQEKWTEKATADPENIVIKDAKEKADAFAAKAKRVTLYGSETLGVLSLICAYVVGFFATAGAAGTGFCSNNKDQKSVYLAGFVGIVLATVLTGTIALVAVVGAQATLAEKAPELLATYNVPSLFGAIFDPTAAKICMLLLAIAAFPSACFPAVVAADAFKTTFPKINPLITAGLGVLVAIGLVVSSWAGQAGAVFAVVGASFGPICGAMAADYLLAGKRWAGPREGFNMPGWISWFFGFIVGAAPLVLGSKLPLEIPCPPVAAIVVGFVLYFLLAKLGMESKVIAMPQRIDTAE